MILCVVMLPALFYVESSESKGLRLKYVMALYSDGKDIPLKQPEGVACKAGSFLLVADTGNGRLLRFPLEEGTIKPEAIEIRLPQVSYPEKVMLSSQGDVYVLDGRQRRIILLTPEGSYKRHVDPAGVPGEGPLAIRSFTLDKDDNIYVLDIRSERVLVLSPDGSYQRHISFPEQYGSLSDLAVDLRGTVFVTDSVNGAVFNAARNAANLSLLAGNLKEEARFTTSMTIDSRGRLYLVDRNGGSIIILGQDGSFTNRQSGKGWKSSLLNYPGQLCMSTTGEVFIADTNNHRVQMFLLSE